MSHSAARQRVQPCQVSRHAALLRLLGVRRYEQFRPSVPQGQAGWGRKGLLELDKLHELQGSAQAS